MTRFDFSPFSRSTVGFDRLFNLLDTLPSVDEAQSYPPYNIEKLDEDAYRITMAVAGFSEDDLEIEARENALVVSGKLTDETGEGRFLHRGIAGRAFKRSFQLADHVKVVGAGLENGLLHIALEREVPESLKPRKIAIKPGEGIVSKAKKVIEGKSRAA